MADSYFFNDFLNGKSSFIFVVQLISTAWHSVWFWKGREEFLSSLLSVCYNLPNSVSCSSEATDLEATTVFTVLVRVMPELQTLQCFDKFVAYRSKSPVFFQNFHFFKIFSNLFARAEQSMLHCVQITICIDNFIRASDSEPFVAHQSHPSDPFELSVNTKSHSSEFCVCVADWVAHVLTDFLNQFEWINWSGLVMLSFDCEFCHCSETDGFCHVDVGC